MQVTETKNEGLSREYKIALSAGEIDEKIDGRLSEYAKNTSLPGFRRGKAPPKILKKRYGKAVMGEVLEKAVNDSSRQAMMERGVRPAGRPKIEITSFDEGADLEYTVTLEVMPEIKPVDFSSLKLERLTADVPESEIDETLSALAARHKTTEKIKEDRPAEKGDVVLIDFLGKIGGEPFAGGAAEDYELELGAGNFIPGFEDQISGKRAGEDAEVKVTFPETYAAGLAGKDAVFECKVKEIRSASPAPVDDELAKKVGLEDLGKLRETVREENVRELNRVSRERLKRALLDALAEAHDFETPPMMVESEFAIIWRQFLRRRAAEEGGSGDHGDSGSGGDDHGHDHSHEHDHDHDHGHNHDDDHDHDHGHDHGGAPEEREGDDKHKAEYREIAERRVRLGLLLAEIGRINEIRVGEEEIDRAVMGRAARFPGQEKQVFEHFRADAQARQELAGPIFEEKVCDFILEMASVSERKISMEELLAGDEDEDEDGDGDKDGGAPEADSAAEKKAPAGETAAG